MRRCPCAMVWTVLCLATLACVPEIEVRSRTRILPNGSAIRETRVVKTRRRADSEAEQRFNERPLIDDLARDFGRGFPSVERTDDEIRLYGVFTDPNRIPPDFLRDVPLVGGQARNRVEFRREDLLLATRFLYREHFIDAISGNDVLEARDGLIELALRFVGNTIDYEFAHAYDTAKVKPYLDERVAPLIKKAIGDYWAERKTFGVKDPVTGESGLDRWLDQTLLRLDDIGLRLDRQGSEADNTAALHRFVTATLPELLVPRHDPTRRATPREFEYLFPEDDPLSGVRLAATRAAERDYGSIGDAKDAFERALLGVVGTFGAPPAEAEFRFDCAVEMPGLLLRTNGYLDGAGGAFFQFNGQQIYPDGVALELESVLPRLDVVGAIRELKPELDRRDLVRLIEQLDGVSPADRARFSELLAQCATHGTLQALLPERGEVPAFHQRLLDLLEPFRR